MIAFVALIVAAVLFKVLGNQVFTPLSVVVAGALLLVRPALDPSRRQALERFLLRLGVLIYALANQEPSYLEHTALLLCMLPSLGLWRRIGQVAWSEGSILLVLLAIVWSVCWTSNLDMSLAGYAMSALCMAFLIAFVLHHEGRTEEVAREILMVLAALMVASWVAGGMGHGSAGRTFSGVTLHRNQLGFLLGVMILLCLFAVRERLRWLPAAGAVSAAGLLLFIDSKSAIIAVALTTVVFLVLSARRWKLLLGALAVGLAVFVAMLPSPKMDHFAMWMGRDPTFTSRTEIWADSLQLAALQPFTGYGYNAVWSAHENRLSQFRSAPGPLYAHAHNAWIDWVLQLGLGGWAIYLLFIGTLLARAWRQLPSPGGRARAVRVGCLLLFIQVYDLANVSTIPITRFGFFAMGVATLCLWLSGPGAAWARLPARTEGRTGWWAGLSSLLPAGPRARGVAGVALAVIVGFIAVSGYALWQDGLRYAATDKRSPPAPNGVAAASLIDPGAFLWQTPERLREYVARHRAALEQTLQRSEAR